MKNSIGLGTTDLTKVLDFLDVQAAAAPTGNRDFIRWPYRHTSLQIDTLSPSGEKASLRVASRNLSRGGMSFLHSAFLHPNTRCFVHLINPDKQTQSVTGEVARSRHIRGMVHEVGVRFDRPIDPRAFAEIDPFAEAFMLERANPELLNGRMLLVCIEVSEAMEVRHALKGTNLTTFEEDTVEDGLRRAVDGFDVVLVNEELEGCTLESFVSDLRMLGLDTPVLIAGDASTSERLLNSSLIEDGRCALAVRPFDTERLTRTIGEFLMLGTSREAILCTLPAEHPGNEILDEFLERARTAGHELVGCINAGDAEGCRPICLMLKGWGPMMGFDPLGSRAADAATALDATGQVEKAIGPLRELIAACSHLRAA